MSTQQTANNTSTQSLDHTRLRLDSHIVQRFGRSRNYFNLYDHYGYARACRDVLDFVADRNRIAKVYRRNVALESNNHQIWINTRWVRDDQSVTSNAAVYGKDHLRPSYSLRIVPGEWDLVKAELVSNRYVTEGGKIVCSLSRD